jgi:POT family proton-dependent oligopeptide transporter
MANYRTAPHDMETMPPGVPYIVANEAAERFSFYGMRGILVVFMTKHLMDHHGALATMSDAEAKVWFHNFVAAVYGIGILGGILSDAFLGKYRTIIYLSIVYCMGHFALAVDETRVGLATGLTLIAIGSGGIKPCVSAHVGDQFGERNQHLVSRVFAWFYWSINLGAFSSNIATPLLLEHYGPSVAFGVPGVLMALATLAFWMGRNEFAHVPAQGLSFVRETFSARGLSIVARLAVVYLFVAMFWALFDQTGSAWVLQADRMDRVVFGHELQAAQIQAANPALVLLFIPLFSYVIYPALDRVFPLTALRKIGIGFFVSVPAFLVPSLIEVWLERGETVSILWQVLAYVLITAAEIFISITALEFSYTQAPNRMKSLVMSLYLASVMVGNLFTSAVNIVTQDEDGNSLLTGADYYNFFALAMLGTAVLFVFYARTYKERRYVQGSDEPIEVEGGQAA